MSGSSGNKVLDRGPVRFLTYFDHVSSVQSAECAWRVTVGQVQRRDMSADMVLS